MPATARAQNSGTIQGTVTRQGDRAPLAGVTVQVPGVAAAVTAASGAYRLERVPSGTHVVTFQWIGFRPHEATVRVDPGATVTLDAALEPRAITLDAVTVAASRTPERIVEAPAAISVVSAQDVSAAGVTGQLPRYLSTIPGVDVVQSGMSDFNINARGFNSTLNRRVLVLQDGRDLATAFIGSQEWNTQPAPEPSARVEFVRGPGSALYGANAFGGVLSITTPSARDVAGTNVSLTAGELGTVKADMRHAGSLPNASFGYRIAGGYSRSDSWSRSRTRRDFSDWRAEYRAGTSDPLRVPPSGHERSALQGQRITDTAGTAVGNLDPISNAFGTARLDFYGANGAIGTLEGGTARAHNEVYVTGGGRIQVPEVTRPWARIAYGTSSYNVAAWYSGRNTTEPQVSLGSGAPLIERSGLYHVEGQHNRYLGQRSRLVLGASFRRYDVNTAGTLLPRADDDRRDHYSSAYSQLEVEPSTKVKLVGAVRWDAGSLFDARLSPKAAVVYSPNAQHSVRLTFNQAFQTPNYAELFLDSRVSQTTGPRALERGIEGLFHSLKSGGLGPALADINLPSDLPWNFDSLTLIRAVGNRDLEVEQVTSWELGYKRSFAGQSYLTIDAYYSVLTDFVTDLLPRVNPSYPAFALADGTVNVARSLDSLETRIRQFQQSGQLSADHAAVVLQTIAQLRAGYTAIAAGLGPLLATDLAANRRAGILSYTNAGRVVERGLEFSAGYVPTDWLRLDGAFTLFLFDVKGKQASDVLLPNTPRHKGSLSVTLTPTTRFDASGTLRVVERFPWAAGIYAGTIPASQILDVNLGLRLNSNLRWFVVGTNLLDQERFSVYGGSVIGRRMLTGLTASF